MHAPARPFGFDPGKPVSASGPEPALTAVYCAKSHRNATLGQVNAANPATTEWQNAALLERRLLPCTSAVRGASCTTPQAARISFTLRRHVAQARQETETEPDGVADRLSRAPAYPGEEGIVIRSGYATRPAFKPDGTRPDGAGQSPIAEPEPISEISCAMPWVSALSAEPAWVWRLALQRSGDTVTAPAPHPPRRRVPCSRTSGSR